MRTQHYRCPDGRITTDIQEYGKAWKELFTKVEKHFPGYRCSGYDPHIHMAPLKPRAFSDDSFYLPVAAAMALE